MMALVALLSVVMGLTLGMLGGGGSILAVPILIYVAGLGPKEAIATSLLVVGATSLVCAAQHARAGYVRWRTGLVFGAVGMVGAYGGGWVAQFFSGTVLLLLFAGMMVAAGLAMIRRRPTAELAPPTHEPSLWKASGQGLLVGAVTGLIGAGGGFLLVPALVLLGGLGMRAAVGTSTLVIAMNVFAGFAGHAAHVTIDWTLAAWVIGFAVLGSVAGTTLTRRLNPARLRAAFGWFVLAMAGVIVWQQATPETVHAILVERWPFWAGGLAIGAFVLLFLRATGQALGVSTGYMDACALPFDSGARRSWRLPFLVGIVLGGAVATLVSGVAPAGAAMGMFDTLVTASLPAKAAIFTGGGVLLGFGARLAGGCTSGHGIVGTAVMARSSIVATLVFMSTGFAVTHLMLRAAGG
ncbi:MAG: TSUP family transporter [Deltaproteobacteria bacterium]|nr:TSUP family transporter [Deltaproteobacteria bacterium]MCB9787996.1 TSUP family transporter [Deltaproteobacteria bacterium]